MQYLCSWCECGDQPWQQLLSYCNRYTRITWQHCTYCKILLESLTIGSLVLCCTKTSLAGSLHVVPALRFHPWSPWDCWSDRFLWRCTGISVQPHCPWWVPTHTLRSVTCYYGQHTVCMNCRLALPQRFGRVFHWSGARTDARFDPRGNPFKESDLGH